MVYGCGVCERRGKEEKKNAQKECRKLQTCETSARKIAGSLPEKSVGEPTNICPFSVISVVMLACGLKGHFATPLSNRVTLRFSICNFQVRFFLFSANSISPFQAVLVFLVFNFIHDDGNVVCDYCLFTNRRTLKLMYTEGLTDLLRKTVLCSRWKFLPY